MVSTRRQSPFTKTSFRKRNSQLQLHLFLKPVLVNGLCHLLETIHTADKLLLDGYHSDCISTVLQSDASHQQTHIPVNAESKDQQGPFHMPARPRPICQCSNQMPSRLRPDANRGQNTCQQGPNQMPTRLGIKCQQSQQGVHISAIKAQMPCTNATVNLPTLNCVM